jgi:hypothetical protein
MTLIAAILASMSSSVLSPSGSDVLEPVEEGLLGGDRRHTSVRSDLLSLGEVPASDAGHRHRFDPTDASFHEVACNGGLG